MLLCTCRFMVSSDGPVRLIQGGSNTCMLIRNLTLREVRVSFKLTSICSHRKQNPQSYNGCRSVSGALPIHFSAYIPRKTNFYYPQTKLREGNVFTPVCQSFCSQGGGESAQPPYADLGIGQTPWMQTPWQTLGGLGRPPLDGEPPGGPHPLSRPHPGCRPPMDETSPPPGIRQQAGGTHPTGMYTCFILKPAQV